MRAITAVADILKYEGVEYIFGIPASPIIDAAAIAGIRPIIPRSEPTAISMADGYVRVSNGHKMGVCFSTIQASAQNLFPGIARPSRILHLSSSFHWDVNMTDLMYSPTSMSCSTAEELPNG